MESRDSTAGSRCNEKDENNIISKRDNHDIDEIVSNNEIASATGIANEDNGNKVNGNEEKLEEKSFISLITKHWKDETKGHPNDVQENCGDERDKKVATTDTHNTDLTGHEKANPVKDMKKDAHFEGNITKTPTFSNYLKIVSLNPVP